ncbi:MAG: hypothetical protein II842_10475 [Butyrivibrio sp.]|nr:hypothetical protein [Butyrivibrio sp.]
MINNNYDYNMAHNELDKHVNMAQIALIMGLLSIPLSFFLYTGIILGGMAIIFAILSKGTADKLLSQAKKGIIYGTIGLVLGYGVMISNFHTVLTNPDYRQELNRMSEQINGVSFDDMLEELGIEF